MYIYITKHRGCGFSFEVWALAHLSSNSLFQKKFYTWWKVLAKCFKIYHILYIWKPKVFFPFLISCYFIFFLMSALLAYADIDQGIHKGKKIKQHEMKNQKETLGFHIYIYIKYGKFWRVLLEPFIKQKPLFSEEWISM